MSRSGAADREDAPIPLAAVARLWGVSRGTVYAWHRAGRVRCFREGPRTLEAALGDVRAEKVLPESSVLSERVTRKLLDNAVATGFVVPAYGRFSLADRDELRRLAGEAVPQEAPREQERHQSGTRLVAFKWTIDAERQWVLEGADPRQLPEAFWATPRPPKYIAPADVFLYRLGPRFPARRPVGCFVWRSAGYDTHTGELAWCEENDRFDRLLDNEAMPQAWIDSSQRHRIGEEQWLREWQRHQVSLLGR
jgi:hypothetical protein